MESTQAVRTAINNAISTISIVPRKYVENAQILIGEDVLTNNFDNEIVFSGIVDDDRSSVIPVFDGIVNPNVKLPTIGKAACYIVIQDQQENPAAVQNMCNERLEHNITTRVS